MATANIFNESTSQRVNETLREEETKRRRDEENLHMMTQPLILDYNLCKLAIGAKTQARGQLMQWPAIAIAMGRWVHGSMRGEAPKVKTISLDNPR
ncbi:unnamed protein product [Ambrosiozyma monospora]|uniref:Unnamed protein product n=1 Tax=Ambrosiozyma monospora TaxID=43982 RepID=A0A9W6YYC8_AMBMO|nr:unnamed protein product [Ambrosiozyma monospora]